MITKKLVDITSELNESLSYKVLILNELINRYPQAILTTSYNKPYIDARLVINNKVDLGIKFIQNTNWNPITSDTVKQVAENTRIDDLTTPMLCTCDPLTSKAKTTAKELHVKVVDFYNIGKFLGLSKDKE